MKKLFIVVNIDTFFLSHRKEIAQKAQESGYQVTIVTKNSGRFEEIHQMGLRTIDLPISKAGKNIWEEFKTYLFLRRLYSQEQPEIVHHVGLKCILWGTLAAKHARVGAVLNAVSGLGVLFASDNHSIILRLMPLLLRYSHRQDNLSIIFQNRDDERLFITNKIISPSQSYLIKGSGVDLNKFCYTPEPTNSTKIRILFTARMVVDKGIYVLTSAAIRLKERYQDRVEFILCGGLEENPNAAKASDLKALCDGTYIQWIGYSDDVLGELKRCHIVAFPSYYNEGLPKSLIEANAVGRPIITTDNIGCRDTVKDGVNGFLIPIKDSEALAEKLTILIENSERRKQIGLEARKFAEREFSIENVVNRHLEIYELLTNKKVDESISNRSSWVHRFVRL
ncbi:MAG: glycosyltransferase family 4 protein [Rikenellaceae bacterium]